MSQDGIRLLHFADAHIDIVNYGRHDPETALPVRVMDFLGSLDQIIARAIEDPVDLVIFAGDTYKDRNPQPTFQREWGKRIKRLSDAGIPTILLVGNHDVAPSSGRANTLQEYRTLAVPNVFLADKIDFYSADKLGIPVQVITIPWISRSAMLTRDEVAGKSLAEIIELIESAVSVQINKLIDQAEPEIPLILAAHTSVQGAKYGSERSIILGQELVLSGSVVGNKRFDYVALGHIHKHQSLNGDNHPPVVYAGSIERIDFGEAKETKGYVLATVSRKKTNWQFEKLKTRPFHDVIIETRSADSFMEDILAGLPKSEKVAGSICRVQLRYPRDWEPLIDEAAIFEHFRLAYSLQIQKIRDSADRSRLGSMVAVETLSRQELLEKYWQSIGLESQEVTAMQNLAEEVIFSRSSDQNF